MKRLFSLSVLTIFAMALLSNISLAQDITVKTGTSSHVYKGTVYNLELNGVWVPTETPVIVVSGVAYVPLREVFQDYLGLTVGYDSALEMAYVQSNSNKMEFSYKDQAIFQNGKKLDSSLPVANINGNTMVPLSLTAGYFGYTVGVKSDNKTITIQWNNKNETSAVVKDAKVTGTVSKISYYSEIGKENILIETTAKEIKNHYVIEPVDENPFYRLCVQIQKADIEYAGKLDVYAGSVQQIRYAQADAAQHIANVVIEVDHKPQYTINAVSNGIEIAIVSSKNSTGATKPEPTQAPKPTEAPEPTQAPKPTETPHPTQAPEPAETPKQDPSPDPTGAPTPTPTHTQIGNGAIYYIMDGNDCVVFLDGINLLQQIEQNPDQYSMEYRTIEKILQIRLPITENYRTEVLPGNTLLHGIIAFNSNMRQEVNIRISGREPLSYAVEPNGNDGTKIRLREYGGFAQQSPSVSNTEPTTTTPTPTPVASKPEPTATTPTPQPSITPIPTQPQPQPEPTPALSPPQLASRGEGARSGTVSYVAGTDTIIIDTNGLEEYRVFRLSDPARIVIDLYQNIIESKHLDVPEGRMYTKIRTGQFETTTARIVLDIAEDHDFEAVKNADRLTVKIKPSGIRNMTFESYNGLASLILTSPGLRTKIENNIDNILIEDDKEAKTFAFVFTDGMIDLGNGKLQAGDKIMKCIQTLTSGNNAFLVIERENNNTSYRFRYTDSDDVVIIEPTNAQNSNTGSESADSNGSGTQTGSPSGTTVNPMAGGKLVVLDPGHGGSEPGATYGKDEKWYNLDITKRLEAILVSNGVNVKLTRTTDEFVSLDERVKMANDWEADFFLSVHNNAFFDKGMHGTMTFFYTGSYKGKEYATIIQNDLLKNLGSKDLGVKSNTFVVIKKTKMPAVLVEIGCLSNADERAKLDTEEYRQKAAESLAESIMKIMDRIE
jgi:N-acetylmuramoyl-L-alanine amidase